MGRILDDEGGSGPAVSARNDNSGNSSDVAGRSKGPRDGGIASSSEPVDSLYVCRWH